MTSSTPTPDQSLTSIRRKDRAVHDDTWIRDMLYRAAVGVLATEHGGQPFLNTSLFVYDKTANAIYMHGARNGRTYTNLMNNPCICFSISEMGRLLPAEVALKFSVEYASVVVFGKASIVDDMAEAQQALQQLLDKYCPHLNPGTDYRPITDDELGITAVYRIDIDEWSGKKKAVAPDFPGAFFYTDAPPEQQA